MQKRKLAEPRPDPNLTELKRLAGFAIQKGQKEWRRRAVNPQHLEAQLSTPDVPNVGPEEFLFCLGWAHLAWDKFGGRGKGPFNDEGLVEAIKRAMRGKDTRAG